MGNPQHKFLISDFYLLPVVVRWMRFLPESLGSFADLLSCPRFHLQDFPKQFFARHPLRQANVDTSLPNGSAGITSLFKENMDRIGFTFHLNGACLQSLNPLENLKPLCIKPLRRHWTSTCA